MGPTSFLLTGDCLLDPVCPAHSPLAPRRSYDRVVGEARSPVYSVVVSGHSPFRIVDPGSAHRGGAAELVAAAQYFMIALPLSSSAASQVSVHRRRCEGVPPRGSPARGVGPTVLPVDATPPHPFPSQRSPPCTSKVVRRVVADKLRHQCGWWCSVITVQEISVQTADKSWITGVVAAPVRVLRNRDAAVVRRRPSAAPSIRCPPPTSVRFSGASGATRRPGRRF